MRIEAADAANALINYIMAGLMELFAGGSIWYFKMPLIVDPRSPAFFPPIVIPGVLVVIGLYYLCRAMLDSLRIWRFGISTLRAEPASLGHAFTGVVSISRPLDVRSTYSMRLTCIETRCRGIRFTQRFDQKTRWQASQDVSAESVSRSGGVPVSFHIPEGCPATTHPDSGPAQVGVRWILEARAPMRGLHYYALFRLNVHKRSSRSADEEGDAT